MDHVGKECDAPAHPNDEQLEEGRRTKTKERHLERPYPAGASREGRIYTGGTVRVAVSEGKKLTKRSENTMTVLAVAVLVDVIMIMIMLMMLTGVVIVIGSGGHGAL